MAPNRKKKKPAVNPARGFATTSTASKPKIDDTTRPSEDARNKAEVDHAPQNAIVAGESQRPSEPEKELSELTPEQLESQLEESELQLMWEKFGERCKREASRQTSRLQTEKRLLRVQAEPLNILRWLPHELMQLLADQVKAEILQEDINADSDRAGDAGPVPEDIQSTRLWTLSKTLRDLGFSEQRAHDAICQMLCNESFARRANGRSTKDSIWGLEECLDWLAAICEPAEVPDYAFQKAETKQTQLHSHPLSHLNTRTKQTLTRDSLRQENNAVETAIDFEGSMLAVRDTSSLTEQSNPINEPSQQAPPIRSPERDGNDGGIFHVRSDSESDLDPDQQIEKYLSLQTQLYQIRPDLTAAQLKKSKKHISRPNNINTQLSQDISTDAVRLLKSIRRLESDILFDQDEARAQWSVRRQTLTRELAERKRYNLDMRSTGSEVSTDTPPRHPGTPDTSESTTDDDTTMMLGDMFSALPESRIDKKTGLSSMMTESADGSSVLVRDFGKWTGTSPRRIFEEACRTRDAAARISFNLVSESTFSNRHALSVEWTYDQELPLLPPTASVACVADNRSVVLEMLTVSTPTAEQSEAFLSTIGLFTMFSSSTKAHLRLPQTWRDLWIEFSEARKDQVDAADRDELRDMRKLIENCNGVNKDVHNPTLEKSNKERRSADKRNGREILELEVPGALQKIWLEKSSTLSFTRMLKTRMNLPIWNFKDELLNAINSHQVVIVCGETGCGKSTQVPTFILENELSNGRACKIYCTEPRRISAISLARRVSEELGEHKNDVGTLRSVVGFAIRLESRIAASTRLVYATTGIVMRMLERSDDLGDITHLILDEVHERTIDSDFLLLVLRKLMIRRPALKVILMSATVNGEQFSRYLGGALVMNVPGRTFPVETKYLEDAIEVTKYSSDQSSAEHEEDDELEETPDGASKSKILDTRAGYSSKTRATLVGFDEYHIEYNLITTLLSKIANDEAYANYSKAILVFLPGMAEITRLNNMLLGHPSFSRGWYVYPLHSTIATEDQEQAFLVPPQGTRKIVLATNIAETGITIPDVTCVIDTGRHREMRFDERRQLSRLIETFISRANAKQRRGRAGRVQNGLCFHLFTKARHDFMMADQQIPEMLRLSLQDLVLRVKICKLGSIEQTLSEALDPPLPKNVRRAVDALIDVKALTAGEDLTALGRQLAKLPLDVFLGKLVILGSIFGCLDAALTIAAILSSKSPFNAPMGTRAQADAARMAFKKGDSDLLTVYNAYCGWRRVCNSIGSSEYQYCRKNFLSYQTLSNIEDLKGQLATSLADVGFVAVSEVENTTINRARFYSRKFVEIPTEYNLNNENVLVTTSVIAWSFYPKILSRDGKGWRNIANNQSVSLHPTSINKGSSTAKNLSFYHIMQSSNKFYNAHETSIVEDFAIALICGDAEFKVYSGVIVIDGNRLRFSVSDWKTMIAIKVLRTRLREIMSQAFRNPRRELSAQQQVWLDIWQKIFSEEEQKWV